MVVYNHELYYMVINGTPCQTCEPCRPVCQQQLLYMCVPWGEDTSGNKGVEKLSGVWEGHQMRLMIDTPAGTCIGCNC